MTCPDEESVLAFVDGHLDDGQRAEIERHLVDCTSCADLVATDVGGAPESSARQSFGEALVASGSFARGATIGRYVILDLVGRGGMGEVYAAYDPRLDRRVALKLLHETRGGGTRARAAQERLLREAQTIARLSHPNVVVVHDAGAIDDEPRGVRVYIAMAFVEGRTLADWLGAEQRSWRAILDVFIAAGEGLQAAHEAGLVHRDFKPQNVMVANDGTVRVMDFGLASDAGEARAAGTPAFDPTELEGAPSTKTVAMTDAGVLLGTPLYMAPEQFLAHATDARTDQFGFCVALYEALYRERPFPAESFSALVAAVTAGRPPKPPTKARVPAFVRDAVLRGLKPLPAERHPSMQATMSALRADPARRRWRIAVAAGLVLGAVLATAGFHRAATGGQRMCLGAADKLAGVWELEAKGVRRTAVHDAFVASHQPYAADTWTRASALLDDYSRRWTEAYTDTCEATHLRGEQSPEVMDLRMTCLEGSRRGLRALTDLLSRTDGEAIVGAVDAAHGLPPIERCADVAALRAVVPLPADPGARARISVLQTQLAEVRALVDTGRWKEARDRISPLVEAARTADYGPLLAEALSARAWLEYQLGDPRQSSRTYEEALWAALEAHRDDAAAESAAQLVVMTSLDGHTAGSTARERWDHLAEALLERIGPGHERTLSWLHQNRGIALMRLGTYQQAAPDLQLARTLKESILPPNHPDIAISLVAISLLDGKVGDKDAALATAERALAIETSAYGATSPLVADALQARGRALSSLHRYAEAETDLRSALSRTAAYIGPEHSWNAQRLADLGEVLVTEGRHREAAPLLERALRIGKGAELVADEVADARFALAQAHWTLDRDRASARAMAIKARNIYRSMPRYRRQAAEVEAWLATHT